MGKEAKTNAMRILDKNKIPYEMNTYTCDEFIDGCHIADQLGQPYERSFKTLVTVGRSNEHYVFVVPVAKELDLKKAAKTVGEKSIEMIKSKELLGLTGYIHGGCSPVGMKKFFRTVFDISAKTREKIFFSGGRIGLQIETSPSEIEKVIRIEYADIAK